MPSDGVWLEARTESDGRGPLAAWITEPSGDRRSGAAALLLPAIGYAYSSSHHQLRAIAEGLARDGIRSMRLDYWGTGDSGGASDEVTSVGQWRESVRRAVEELREDGAREVFLVGIQWGATLAALDKDELGVDGVVEIAPVSSGRRFVRGMSMIGRPVPGTDAGVSDGGYLLSGPLLADLAALELAVAASESVLVIPSERAAGFLDRPAEEAIVDLGVIDDVVGWIRAHSLVAHDAGVTTPPRRAQSATEVDWSGGVLRAEFVRVGPDRLGGVLTRRRPSDPSVQRTLLVLVNSGSDPHSGPGRAWTELARYLAVERGIDTLRVDLPGWGETDGGAHSPGRPYDEHGIRALRRLLVSLDDDWGAVIVGGLCAGAWIGLDVARDSRVPLAGVVALNPQLYWRRGDPVEALMSTTRARRADEIATIKVRRDEGRWDAEDAQGVRPPAAVWLDDLVDLRRPMALVFAEGDDGLEFLRDRLGRRLEAALESGVVRVTEVEDIDHAMHSTWLRPRMFAAIAEQIAWAIASSDRRETA